MDVNCDRTTKFLVDDRRNRAIVEYWSTRWQPYYILYSIWSLSMIPIINSDEIIKDQNKMKHHLSIYFMGFCPFEKTEWYKDGINFYLYVCISPFFVTTLIHYLSRHLPWGEVGVVVFCCNAVVWMFIFFDVVLTL